MKIFFLFLVCNVLLTGCDFFNQDQCLDDSGSWNNSAQRCEK